jgi:hypothetical protein
MSARETPASKPVVSIVEDNAFNSDLSDALTQSAAALDCIGSLCGACEDLHVLGDKGTYGLTVILDSIRDRLQAMEDARLARWTKIRGERR